MAKRSVWFMVMGVLGCAAADEVQAEDVTTSELSAMPFDGAPPRPPEEAFEACDGLAVGAACSVAIRDRSIDGTCRQGPPGEDAIVCVPADMPALPPVGRAGPPREALDACAALAADATCSFEIDGHAVHGTCWAPPAMAGAPLACAPPEIRERLAPRS